MSDQGKLSNRDLAARVHWQGGVLAAEAAGIDSCQLADPNTAALWARLARFHGQLTPLMRQVEPLLRATPDRATAGKVGWEGGIEAALDYGIGSDEISDTELAAVWARMEVLYDQLRPLVRALEKVLKDTHNRCPARPAAVGFDPSSVRSKAA